MNRKYFDVQPTSSSSSTTNLYPIMTKTVATTGDQVQQSHISNSNHHLFFSGKTIKGQ
jgi:hypothetical protein